MLPPPLPERPPLRQRDHADVGEALQHDGAEDAREEADPPEEADLEDGPWTEPRGRQRGPPLPYHGRTMAPLI